MSNPEQENSSSGLTPGMQQAQNAVEFINKTVLKPDVIPLKGSAKTMADQAAGMMVQDMQSFLQGSEQVLIVATGKAAALVTNPETVDKGVIALTALSSFLGKLNEFAGGVGYTSSLITHEFDNVDKPTKDDILLSTPKMNDSNENQATKSEQNPDNSNKIKTDHPTPITSEKVGSKIKNEPVLNKKKKPSWFSKNK